MARKSLTEYDKEIEQLTEKLKQARARYDAFIKPLRKRRHTLRVLQCRARKNNDLTKFVQIGNPEHAHLIPDSIKSMAAAVLLNTEPSAPVRVTPVEPAYPVDPGPDCEADDLDEDNL